MPVRCNTYLLFSSQKAILSIVLFFYLGQSAYSQDDPVKDTIVFHINPLHVSLKPVPKASPALNEHFKRPNNELMSWPNFPLTASQIEQRDKEYNRPLGKQIVDDIMGSYINVILNGKKKKPVAKAPRF